MPSIAGSGRTGGREAHKMKTLMRHGLAVCLALTTMCTSLLLMYGGIGIGGGHPEPRRRQQQVAAVPSRPPERGQRHPALPVGAGLLEGYISVLEHKPLKMHCKSCALVTSSGHLLGSRQGDRIDESECVIRMNDAPTQGYGKDVGNKTSLRVIAHSSIQRILRNRNELLNMSHGAVFIFWGPSSYMRRDGKGLVYNNLQLMNQILPQLKVYMISRHKMLQFDDLFKRETGKDRDPNHLSVPYHYYEPLGPDECTMYISHERGRKGSHHRFITEKRVFENWARTFDIHFFQPDWKPEPLTVTHPEVKPMA
ncbi:alpha-N-acetylgalactosaminide alpha-2,6-sialyltransferase 5 isoform X2 [Corvus hawaiiensis]|uniref:alpha-N-acetylgalactosaminide alpha-2,6-sialyltransferase 5 isoform X2 n=1 Tax=Corvus moneduloides TaxID=1196302 RepID=UPI0013646ADB|nr:alpha-N-acetylgalactosaminide alpha-2,6-sialyltransferase 5 isoform X2 [Corvus moneduloides]XP_041886379.1 alpha-N-acetylgalactosaminide alpha-2,6-sialyltransferase 5 isoform X2 [Corvus kubaryi]XP_048169323.1 alpha-N-acetylgalactosaminide alpha-2,6-sialyltransferase 5 isoform X2 [Corvus hawaiiensis]